MRKYAPPVFVALLVIIAGYYLLRWWGRSQAAWQYIPASAMAVITSDRLQDSSFVVSEANIDVKSLPIVDVANDNLTLLNWLATDPTAIRNFLARKTITFSYHPGTGNSQGVIMYIPIANENEKRWLENPPNPDIRMLHHTYQSARITDINDANSRSLFSYLVKDDYLILSHYGNLIEDVVRESSSGIKSFLMQSKFEFSNDAPYALSIYLKRVSGSAGLLPITFSPSLANFAQVLPAYQDYHLEVDKKTGALHFKSLGCDIDQNYLTGWLDKQAGAPFRHQSHISQQTSYLYRVASKDSAAFRVNYLKWHQQYASPAWSKVNYYVGKESTQLLRNLGPEVILCQLEESNSVSDGKVLLVTLSNYDKIRPLLKKLAQLSTSESGVAVDKFQGYDLYSLAIPELPQALFGNLFTGFARSYVTYVEPYLVVSNNPQALRNYLVDYENQLTWKQSPEYDSLLATADSQAQLSMVLNLQKSKTGLARASTKSYAELTSEIESVIYQCRFEGKTAFPELILNPKKRRTSSKVLNKTFLNVDVEWPVMYDSLLVALQNPVDGNSELLLTDKTYKLLKVNNLKTGEAESITQLDGEIVTPAFKVDFLNIGRQQRIVATANSLYTLDEDDADLVTTLTATLPSASPIKALYRVEGGKEGSSRFVVQDANQDIYLWEQVFQVPRKINRFVRFESISRPVVSLNLQGNRFFIVTQRNGKIFLLKESGLVVPGFPADILTRAEGAFTWTQNATSAQPELVGVSTLGELITIDLNGQITTRRQLLRPEPSSRFRTLFDKNSLDWLILRLSDNKAAILNKEGQELFEIKNVQPNAELQYHFFGVDNRFITIGSRGYTSVFDLTGRRLGDKPIPSEIPVSVTYQAPYYKLFIFGRSQDKIQTWSIKLR
nr:hypothetical protein [Rhabdobacter roseus]